MEKYKLYLKAMNKFEARQEILHSRSGLTTKVLRVMRLPRHHLKQLKFPWIADLLQCW